MYLIESFSDLVREKKQEQITIGIFVKRLFLCMFGFSGNDFINYNLKKYSLIYIISEFIPYYRRKKMRGNDFAHSAIILRNKYETLKILTAHKVPTSVPRYLIVDSAVFSLNENFEKWEKVIRIHKGSYVIKPVNQRWGKGIKFLEINDDIDVSECTQIQDAISSGFNPLLIEIMEKNHPDLENLSKSSLNTLRIITVKTKKEHIYSIFACIRFSSSKERIDNWSAGGFAAYIDLDTGICHTAIKKETVTYNSVNHFTEGLTIPFFHKAKELAERAHAVFPDMKSIGWDIAVTPNGAIIIEGNDDWDVILPQKLTQKGIKKLLCKK